MPLSNTFIKNAKPKDKQYKVSDERGMYLLVTKSGKYFRLDYRFLGKRKTLSLGVYPDVSLKMARERRDEARQHIANGVDPAELRKHKKQQAIARRANSFEAVALEWISGRKEIWTKKHRDKVLSRLRRDVFPVIGGSPMTKIEAPQILTLLRRVEGRGAIDCAHRVKQDISRIFRYAIVTHRASRDPAADLKGALRPIKKGHFASITEPREIGALMRAIDGYTGSYITKYALALSPLFFVRPGELRQAEWVEFDLDAKEWRIPAERMKMDEKHIVPLSFQAIALIEQLRDYSGHTKYLFPSLRSDSRPMSDNTINAALRRMGYSTSDMTAHGFRSMASTSLHEQGWNPLAIERQLAHAEPNEVKAAYNYSKHLPERRKMMQAWADYLDILRSA